VLTYLPTQEIELNCLNYNSAVPVSRTDELLMDGHAYYVAVFPRELNYVIYSWDLQDSDPTNRDLKQRRLYNAVTIFLSFIRNFNKLK
jgi:hypothetical protein